MRGFLPGYIEGNLYAHGSRVPTRLPCRITQRRSQNESRFILPRFHVRPLFAGYDPGPAALFARLRKGKQDRDCRDLFGCLGSTLDNPGVQAVLQAIREGKTDTILVTDRDRLNKGMYLEELQNLSVIETGSKGQHREREADHAL